MVNNTKQEILKAAKKLFNEYGYNAVSLRDISGLMGISKGNLTYHFRKKEDIIESILDDITSGNQLHEVPKSITEMNDMFVHMQNIIKENAFYFWNHAQLSQLSLKIRMQQKKAYLMNHQIFMEAIFLFNKDGIVMDEEFNGQYGQMVDSLLIACTYWIPFQDLKCDRDQQIDFLNHAWGVIFPLLTDTGKQLLFESKFFQFKKL